MAAAGKASQQQGASINPDFMVSAGLMDDFDGRIVKARFVPWDYNGKIDHHVLGVAVTIEPEEGDLFTQTYSAGDLETFVPSEDGVTPLDLDVDDPSKVEGRFAAKVGRKDGLNNNSNFAQFIGALLDAGFDKTQLSSDVSCLEGVYGHFNRIPQKKRSGIVSQGAEGAPARVAEILVVTELKDAPKAAPGKAQAANKAVAAKPAAKVAQQAVQQAAPAAATSDDLDEQLANLVIGALATAGDDGLPKNKLAALALKGLPGNLKAKGVKRITDTAFLESNEAWAYDADSGTLMGV